MPIIKNFQYRFRSPTLPAHKTFVDFSGGLNTRDSEFDVTDNELTKAQNVRYTAQGGFKKRPGLQKQGEQIGTSTKILGLHSYVKSSNTAYLLAGFGTSIYNYTEAGTPITIATSSSAQATGYSKDRHVFFTSANLDTNGNPHLVVLYQSGSGIKLEWSDSTGAVAYGTWNHSVIDVDASTQTGFFGYMDSSDNIHIAFNSDGNTVKYVKMTYAAGPTWSAGTATTVKGSGASDSALNPCIFVTTGGVIYIGYRYYNGTTYQVRAIFSTDSGTTWTNETNISTASTNARHFATMTHFGDIPIIVYQVGGASSTSFYFRFYAGSWTSETLVTSTTSSTDNTFSALMTGSTLNLSFATATASSGVVQTAFGSGSGANRRRFEVVNDGSDDNDVIYYNIINGATDNTATRVSNDSNNNLYPSSPEYVSASASFVPVVWTEGTADPFNIKINSSAKWSNLTASLTSGLRQASAYFPLTAAGGTDCIYITNGTDDIKKWDGTSLSTYSSTGRPTPTWICHFENRLWMGGDTNAVYYTDKGADNVSGTFPTGNRVDFPEQTVWGHWIRDNMLLVFTRFNVWVINNFSYSGAAVGPEVIRKLPNSYGTLSGFTVKQIGPWVYYQRPDGHVMRTNGSFVQLVSDKISGTINDLTTSLLSDASAGTLGNYYYVSVAGNAAGQVNNWLVLDTDLFERNGGGWSVDTGKTTSCFVTHPDANGVPQLFAGESTTSSGQVYKAEITDSDNEAAITMDARTGIKVLGDASFRKLLRDITIYAEASGDYLMQVGYARFQNLNSFTQFNVDLNPQSGVWGAGTWNPTSIWGGFSHIENKHEINARDRLFKFQFYQSGAEEPVSVLGYSVTFKTIKDQL